MSEFLGNMKRSQYCGLVTEDQIGQTLTVMGWTAKRRNLGSLIFVDLRDRTGILQVVFDEAIAGADVFAKAESIRSEYVLAVTGSLRIRSSINENLPTGRIELAVTELKILSESETPPFAIDDTSSVNETLRLKYRYLDLRTPYLQNILILRSKVANVIRNYLCENDFLEIETPFLGRSTPEGARDYLVPSRVHPGEFYALPQSPQLYKQLLMLGGYDRYFQIARCFRDEDLRANRQPEFTQVDMEMSFVDSEEDVMTVAEGMIRRVFKECINVELDENIRRITWQEAMDRFGSDKPDTRFGLEIVNVSDLVADCGFQVFSGAVAGGGSVRLINAKGFMKPDKQILSRRDIDALGEFVKTYRAKGLAWMAIKPDGIQSAIAKFLAPETVQAICDRANAEVGDVLLFVADVKNDVVYQALGALRLELAAKGDLIDKTKYDVLWVTEFPQFEWSEEEGRAVAVHHPFTHPKTEDIPLLETEPLKVRAKAYDMVINGYEAGGGSIRIHSQELQKQMFSILGLTDEQIAEKFGWFADAFKYGAPPHGGLAFGLDRLVMLLTGTDNIKDVIAFPKVQNASDLMCQAPAPVEEKQLKDLALLIENEQE